MTEDMPLARIDQAWISPEIEAVAAVARLVAGSRGGAVPEVSASVRNSNQALVVLPAFDPETAKLVLQAALQLAYFAYVGLKWKSSRNPK